jgi:hypothetical protein
MRKIGYARVSSAGQNLDRQIAALRTEGCLSRYTHRVAISNRRLVSADDNGIAFRWKDYRIDGPDRWKTMTLHPHEFIRRFLIHVHQRLPPHPPLWLVCQRQPGRQHRSPSPDLELCASCRRGRRTTTLR